MANDLLELLQTARRLREQGDRVRARLLLRVLSAQYPDQAAIWLNLATVAEDRQEQQHALERVIALDPGNPAAQRALARFQAEAPTPLLTPVTDIPPPLTTAQSSVLSAPPTETTRRRLPMLVWLLPATLCVGGLLIWALTLSSVPTTNQTTALPATQVGATMLPPPTATRAAIVVTTAAPTTQVTTGITTSMTPIPQPTAFLTPTLPLASSPTPTPTLAPTVAMIPYGAIVQLDAWRGTLLRASDVRLLNGAIGSLQPRGRFVVALMTISHTGPQDAVIPTDFVTLVDQQGTIYRALPGASSTYLSVYPRGQFGDAALEEPLPPNGNRSVPIVFDIPAQVVNLRLVVGGAQPGWLINPLR